jgi:hypothetical protein
VRCKIRRGHEVDAWVLMLNLIQKIPVQSRNGVANIPHCGEFLRDPGLKL